MQNLQDVMDHDSALTVSCRDCGAAEGDPCTAPDRNGIRHPLTRFPAHPKRIKRAARIARLQAFDAERAAARAEAGQ
ncbi:hypothetical protein [Prescottella equi]|uniref:DNA-binding phage zinc finger domain-containing protein n=1 Tax=Rhodococcus hoagii TaxID=43767 RepID=A0AAE5IWH2_RHOHA|nr:hypothetical protein [Prescottella equi]MBM4516401.1 hypothetical protein [Prescottella equi]MBM4577214.1 hypothetical protein [Prescottella equi]NKV08507.1 hypothetical protein [Prescottella equi]NKV08516.1 hypothetical protein [Prescottella equi]NKV09765.1 hypothetical protein [Prescottella equi]